MMRALTITQYAKPLVMKSLPIKKPTENQVLVKMVASPINPSDLGFIHGVYGTRRPTTFPVVPGLEGTGVVSELGPGAPKELIGQQVSLFLNSQDDNFHGCWCEYVPVGLKELVPLKKDTDYKLSACSIVNPFTALSFIHIAKKEGVKSIIHTAAASAVGKMLMPLAKKEGIQVINVIRNKEEEETIRKAGGEHILNYMEADFDSKLNEKVKELNPLITFNAVGNELCAKILKAMPENSTVYQYSNIAMKPLGEFMSEEFLFKNKTLRGFWVSKYIRAIPEQDVLEFKRAVAEDLGPDGKHLFASTIQAEYPLEKYDEARRRYVKNMTKGKVLLKI